MTRPGEQAPELALHDAQGNVFRLSDHRGRSPVVLFFYPKDDTYVCTREACAFRDRYDEFRALGAVVVGISDDDGASHQRFADAHALPYPLLSDPGGAARKAFGAVGLFGLMKARVTVVIDREGRVLHRVRDRLRAQVHVDEALDALRAQRRS